MDVQRLASFTYQGQGGNPAGVVLCDALPDAEDMQRVAAEVGYSETAFAAPEGDGFRTRYFAPQAEVPFCGHATIALGAALGAAHGAGRYDLHLNEADISVTAYQEDGAWGASLMSPPTHYAAVTPADMEPVLALFGLSEADLAPDIAPAMINGGAQHLALPVASRDIVQQMDYAFDAGAALMQARGLVTINMFWRESPTRLHSRNAFAGHGVYEDPATGAAAAALAGYLRDAGYQSAPFEVIQGVDMGQPSLLQVTPQTGQGAPIEVTGMVRQITA